MNLALAASLLPLLLAPMKTRHGEPMAIVGQMPAIADSAGRPWTRVVFSVAVSDTFWWAGRDVIMLEFPHSRGAFAFEQWAARADGVPLRIGPSLRWGRSEVALYDSVSIPASSLAVQASDDGRRTVMLVARFPGTFSADSVVRAMVGLVSIPGEPR